jgi:hypothetical protein
VVEDKCAGLKQWKCQQNKACSYDFAGKSCALAVVEEPTPSPTAEPTHAPTAEPTAAVV